MLKRDGGTVIHPGDRLGGEGEALEDHVSAAALGEGNVCVTVDAETVLKGVENAVVVHVAEDEVLFALPCDEGAAVINGVAVKAHPAAEGIHQRLGHERHSAVAHRADVQQQVRADLSAGADAFDDLRWRLEVQVVRVAPMVVQRHGHFGGEIFLHTAAVDRCRESLLVGDRVDMLVADGTAPLKAGVVDDHGLGLIAADHRVELILLPINVLAAPVAVKFKAADRAVVLTEQLNAFPQILEIGVEVAAELGMHPVEGGVIEMRNDIRLSAFIDELADQIAPGEGVRRIVIVQPTGVVERKSVVVARGEADVLASRRFRNADDFRHRARRKALHQRTVFSLVDMVDVHRPFALLQKRVETEMHVHTECVLLKSRDIRRGSGDGVFHQRSSDQKR